MALINSIVQEKTKLKRKGKIAKLEGDHITVEFETGDSQKYLVSTWSKELDLLESPSPEIIVGDSEMYPMCEDCLFFKFKPKTWDSNCEKNEEPPTGWCDNFLHKDDEEAVTIVKAIDNFKPDAKMVAIGRFVADKAAASRQRLVEFLSVEGVTVKANFPIRISGKIVWTRGELQEITKRGALVRSPQFGDTVVPVDCLDTIERF